MELQLPLFNTTGGFLGNQVSPVRLVNMYVANIPSTKGVAVTMMPGTATQYSTAGNNTRLLYTNPTDMFAVFDEHLVIFNTSLTPSSVGDFTTTSGYIGVSANNSKQITFVDNVDGWVYDYSTMTPTFTQITDVDFPSQPVDTTQLDGYTIVGQSSSNKWYVSDIGNSTSYDALNFARLTSREDTIVGVRVLNRRIYIFGNLVTEVFYNSASVQGDVGISTFPFVRDDNNILEFGCGAVGSIAQDENKLVFLTSQKNGGPSIRLITEGGMRKISSLDIDYNLEQLLEAGKTLSDAQGFLYKFNGIDFYLINFITANKCYQYSFDTDTWNDIESISGNTYFASVHAYFNNKHFLGNTTLAQLRVMSDIYVRNDAEDIHCKIITPIIEHPSMQRLELKRIILQCKQGQGQVTTYLNANGTWNDFGLNPELYLSVSQDGGETYQGPAIKSIGRVGYYDWETFWNAQNLSRRYVFKFEKFQPFKLTILNAVLVYELKGY